MDTLYVKRYIQEIKEYYPQANLSDWQAEFMLVQELVCMEQMMMKDTQFIGGPACYNCPMSFIDKNIPDEKRRLTGLNSYCARSAVSGCK